MSFDCLGLLYCFYTEPDDVRLVGGTSHCNGRLEMKHQEEWRPVDGSSKWNRQLSAAVCRQLDCGDAISTKKIYQYDRSWEVILTCIGSEFSLKECGTKTNRITKTILELICSGKNKYDNGTVSLSVCVSLCR